LALTLTLSPWERELLPLALWERGRGEGDLPALNQLCKGLAIFENLRMI
jgi:hypothetical protein